MGKSFNTGNLTNIIGYSGSNVAITGSVNISGTVVSTGTSLVSGSGQISYTGITNIPSGIISGSSQLPSGIVSSSAQTIANLPSGVVSGSGQIPAILPSGVVSGSAQVTTFGFGTTGSNTFQGSQTINGSLVVTGSLTAQQYIISSSVTYLTESFASGSHKFGDSSDDTHQFTGSLTTTGNVGIGIADLGPDGLSLPTTFNYSWSEGSGNAYAVLFRQRNSAATVIASGYKRSNSASFASSYGISMARAAIAVGYNNGSIAFFSDTTSNVANGTDITPTERMTLNSSGNLTVTGTINGLSIPNDLFAQQFLLMGA